MKKKNLNEEKRKNMKLSIVVTLTLAAKIHAGAWQKLIHPLRCPFVPAQPQKFKLLIYIF